MNSLKQKSVLGVAWSLGERFGVYGIKFILGIILARLLTPEAFGLIGMITVFFTVAQVFIDSGFSGAYVQKKEITDKDANTVFYTNLIISLILYGALWFAAPLIARFYEEPSLTELTRVTSIVLVINGFQIIQKAQLTRAINFRRKSKIALTAALTSGIIGVTAAYYGLGVWSLVIQQLANRFLTTVGLWFTSTWKPKWQFSKQSFREMFSFGSWMLLAGIIRRIFDNIYILVIGKFFSAGQLGFYTKAKQFQRLLSERFAAAIGGVAFPVFSKAQNNKQTLKQYMRKFLQQSMFFMVPLLMGLIVVAKPFVIVLLKEKWAPMIPYLQLLCIIGILYPLHLINVQALVAQGKSRLSFKLDLLKNGLRVLNIIVSYRFGVIYIILGEILLSFIALWINTWYTKKYVKYGLMKQFKDIYLIFVIGITTALITYFGINFFFEKLLTIFITSIIIFTILYTGLSYLLNRKLFQYTLDLLKGLKIKS